MRGVCKNRRKGDGMETGPSSTTFTSYLRKAYYITDSRYVVTIENDTLAVKKWFPCVLEALRHVEAEMEREKGAMWIYSSTQKCFSGGIARNSQRTSSGISWSWATVTASLIIAKGRSNPISMSLSNASIMTMSWVFLPALITLLYIASTNSI